MGVAGGCKSPPPPPQHQMRTTTIIITPQAKARNPLQGCVFLNTAKTPSTWALAKLCNGAGIGVLQIVCQVYVMEICPNKIRGGMVTFQQVWSNIGGIIVAVMMQQLNKKHPDNYLLAMRILWAPIGLMIVFWTFIPESPWYHARRGEKEKAMKCLRQLFGGVEGYDFEEEYGIIARTIQHEQTMNQEKPSFADVFRGFNLVSFWDGLASSCFAFLTDERLTSFLFPSSPETNPYLCCSQHFDAVVWTGHYQYLFDLYVYISLYIIHGRFLERTKTRLIIVDRLLLPRRSGRPVPRNSYPQVSCKSLGGAFELSHSDIFPTAAVSTSWQSPCGLYPLTSSVAAPSSTHVKPWLSLFYSQ